MLNPTLLALGALFLGLGVGYTLGYGTALRHVGAEIRKVLPKT